MLNIYNILDNLNIKYKREDHPPFFTCDDADNFYKKVIGGKSKNLFLRNKKGDQHYLVSLESHKRVDTKKLETIFNSTKLSFASADRLMEHLKLIPGSVSPFGLINNTNKEVIFLIDEDLINHDLLYFHPNVNTATLAISSHDFRKFLAWTGNKTLICKI